jgi:hypothetical protein
VVDFSHHSMCGCGWIWNHLTGGQQSAYHEVYMALRCCRRKVISQYLVWAAVTRDDTKGKMHAWSESRRDGTGCYMLTC